jgi:chromosome segregation ATPase
MSTAPSVAPSQALKTGCIGKRANRTASVPSRASIYTTSPVVDPTIDELTFKNTILRTQIEELKEVSIINHLTLQKLADDLGSKDQECAELCGTIRMLGVELKNAEQSIQTNASNNECMKTLERSLCQKEKEIAFLKTKLLSSSDNSADDLSAGKTSSLKKILKQERPRSVGFECLIGEKDNQRFSLQTSLGDMQLAHKKILHERSQLSHEIAAQNELLSSLQSENNNLTNRSTIIKQAVSKINTLIQEMNEQHKNLVRFDAQKKREHKKQVDAIHISYLQAQKNHKTQLRAKDTVIEELRARLERSEATAARANSSRDGEFADLQDQLYRLTTDHDDEIAQVKTWQDHGNEQQIRISALEVENANLKKKLSAATSQRILPECSTDQYCDITCAGCV